MREDGCAKGAIAAVRSATYGGLRLRREKGTRHDAIYNVVVMDLKLREIRGLWIGFDCADFEHYVSAVLIFLVGRQNKYILVKEPQPEGTQGS